MQNSKKLTLSIVIPVYNEQEFIGDCLDSIALQSQLPDEVIVVDNNSTDNSMWIAQKYPFVKIIQEKRQHQSFAQHTGFNHTSSDLIGRIDADSVLPQDWVKMVKEAFSNDANMVAAKGTGEPYDVFTKQASRAVFLAYNVLASKIAGTMMLWGANCIIRRSAWEQIKSQVILRDDIWEDYDIAFCIASVGKIKMLNNIEIGTSFRAVHKPFSTQFNYQLRAIRTFFFRTNLPRTALFALAWFSLIIFYPLIVSDHYLFKPLSKRLQKRSFTIREALETMY